MHDIHEVATLTAKGRLTLPKPIRQALGVDAGGKVAFDLRDGEVVVTRADAEHADPAIGVFLRLLEADIRAGRHLQALPEDLAQAMLAHAGHAAGLDEDDGDRSRGGAGSRAAVCRRSALACHVGVEHRRLVYQDERGLLDLSVPRCSAATSSTMWGWRSPCWSNGWSARRARSACGSRWLP